MYQSIASGSLSSRAAGDIASLSGAHSHEPLGRERTRNRDIYVHTKAYVHLKPYHLKLPLYNRDLDDVEDTSVPFLAPHEILHALFEAGPHVFTRSMVGAPGDIARFWQQCSDQTWFEKHPVLLDGQTIPLLFHVDGCAVFKDAECHIWSFRSAVHGESDDLLHPWQHKCYVGSIPDEMLGHRALREHVEEEILKFIAWSIGHVTWPTHGFYGEILLNRPAGRISPYRLAFAGCCLDWKARRETHRFKRHYGATFICERCMARRVGRDGAYADMTFKNRWCTAPAPPRGSHTNYTCL